LRVLIERKDDAERPATERAQRRPAQGWHAVSIVGPGTACAAALACKGKRFLSKEAPLLPLKNCDAARCDCKYRHFADRRAGDRRRDDAPPPRQTTNRRTSKGRRATD
jgi:hypothetical protein